MICRRIIIFFQTYIHTCLLDKNTFQFLYVNSLSHIKKFEYYAKNSYQENQWFGVLKIMNYQKGIDQINSDPLMFLKRKYFWVLQKKIIREAPTNVHVIIVSITREKPTILYTFVTKILLFITQEALKIGIKEENVPVCIKQGLLVNWKKMWQTNIFWDRKIVYS